MGAKNESGHTARFAGAPILAEMLRPPVRYAIANGELTDCNSRAK
jgi:hypothetical protein